LYEVHPDEWLPSQSGAFPVLLQAQNQMVPDSEGTYRLGLNSVYLWEPSQKGCDWLLPQAHHQYSFPASTSMGIGLVFVSSDIFISMILKKYFHFFSIYFFCL